ncbi:hypothetical protein MPTK1_1g10010 [Marchantia polymorpha subsp. ruderalis]|uniref:Uncharacterized protein n=2 Tax=Marchantia polymorpha TaxID=3197 RepID=A0AAF6ANH3_MARPO|nr:hypothetical protein MARPO_0014s0225 [Marchantia polymorpha]BBM97993.1 hypothetical protein Mp_1g10010 [Marchantia polymorpha subsp. ruderalis]|eukprot:PTQ45733.1 hypothetical protein MARPO_0014s0225 [Marchantia polymorpha]
MRRSRARPNPRPNPHICTSPYRHPRPPFHRIPAHRPLRLDMYPPSFVPRYITLLVRSALGLFCRFVSCQREFHCRVPSAEPEPNMMRNIIRTYFSASIFSAT